MDWLQFSVKGQEVAEIERLVSGYVPGDFLDVKHGMLGYEAQRVGAGSARILSSATRPEIHVILPGDWCGATAEDQLRGLLAWVDAQGTVTRCDLAGDDWDRQASPRDVREAMERGEAVTHTRSHKWYEDLGSKVGTLYLGAPTSRQRVRLYDKGVESKGEIDAVRWELQTRDEAASGLVHDLVLGNWGEVWASRLVQVIDFREPSNRPVNRRPRCDWFEAVVGDAKKAQVYDPRPVRTLEETEAWLERGVSPTLAAVVAARGNDTLFVQTLLFRGRSRWRLKHRQMIAAAEDARIAKRS